MADKPFTGLTAKVSIGNPAETLAYISGFDLTLEKDVIEILQFGAQFKEKVPAIKDWSASIDGTAALSKTGSQKKLYDAFSSGEAIKVEIYLDDNTYFSGSALVSSFNISGAPDDKINLTAELSGTGATELTFSEAGG